MNLCSILPSFPCLEVEEDGEKIVFYRVMMVNFMCQTYWTKKYPDNSMSLNVLSHIWVSAAPWTIALQAPLSREYWNRLPLPTPGDLPNPGIELVSLASPVLAGRFLTTSATWGDCSHHHRWASPNLLRTWIEQKGKGRANLLPTWSGTPISCCGTSALLVLRSGLELYHSLCYTSSLWTADTGIS